MIKAKHKITIGDFDLMESVGKINQFKTWYNIFPVILFAKVIEKRVTELINEIEKTKNPELDLRVVEHELKMQIDINLLSGYEAMITKILVIDTKLINMKNRIKSRKLRKITDHPEQLGHCIDRVYQLCGIKLDTVEDIIRLREYITTKADKLNDRRKKTQAVQQTGNKDKKVGIFYTVLTYLNYLEMSMSTQQISDMRIEHFLSIKQLAIEKMEREKKIVEKYKTA